MAPVSHRRLVVLGHLVLVCILSSSGLAQPSPPDQAAVLQFRGGQIAVAPLSEALALGPAFTMEAWVFATAGEPYGFVFGAPHDPRHEDPYMSYAVSFAEDGARLEFVQTTGASGTYRAAVAPEAFPLNRWVHVAASLSAGQLRLYFDGSLVGGNESPGSPTNVTIPFGVGGGAQADGSVIGGFNGALRQVRVWNRALSESEISAQASVRLTGTEPGLLAYWPLDEGDGRATRDLGPFGLPLQLGTEAGPDPQDPTWVPTAVVTGGPYFVARSMPLDVPEALDLVMLAGPVLTDQVAVVTQLRWPPTVPATELPMAAFRNDGTGRFVAATAAVLPDGIGTVHARAYAVADVDGNGRLDLFIGDHGTDTPPFPGHPNLLLLAQADGSLANETTARMETFEDFSHHVAAGDATGDGAPELLALNTDMSPQFYVNDATGHFATDNARLPAVVTSLGRKYLASIFVDVDRDGDRDLVLGGHNGYYPGEFFAHDALLRNDGTGTFTMTADGTLPPRFGDASWGTVAVAAPDVDADGWPDLVMATYNDYGSAGRFYTGSQLLLNRQDGTFVEASDRLPFPPDGLETWVLWHRPADFNGDGWTDLLVVVNGDNVRLYLNTGGGTFEDASALLPARVTAADIADVDGDGDPDIVGFGGGQFYVIENVAPFSTATSAVPLPAPPVLQSPVEGGRLVPDSPLLWSRVPSALSYDVQVSSVVDFKALAFERAEVSAERALVDMPPTSDPLYWRVRARNTRGVGDWSAPGSFFLDVTSTAGEEVVLGGAVSLDPPHPNPALGAVTITAAAPAGVEVWVDVVDPMGRVVETLWSGPSTGALSIQWETSSRASGTYFVRLSAAGVVQALPLLVIR